MCFYSGPCAGPVRALCGPCAGLVRALCGPCVGRSPAQIIHKNHLCGKTNHHNVRPREGPPWEYSTNLDELRQHADVFVRSGEISKSGCGHL